MEKLRTKVSFHLIMILGFIFISNSIKAQTFTPNKGKNIVINEAKIYYEEYGEGKPVILLHHFMSTGTNGWSSYIPLLAKNYKVIVPDLRGHGKSTNPKSNNPWKIDDSASDLLVFLDSLNITKISAIGGSAGASTLLNAATVQPERFEALVIVGGSPFRNKEFRDWILRSWSEEISTGFIELHGSEKANILNRQFRELANQYRDHELTPDRLNRITARTLIVHGDNDPIIPVDYAWEVYKAISDSHLWIVPNGGHLPYLYPSNKSDFATRIQDFLLTPKND